MIFLVSIYMCVYLCVRVHESKTKRKHGVKIWNDWVTVSFYSPGMKTQDFALWQTWLSPHSLLPLLFLFAALSFSSVVPSLWVSDKSELPVRFICSDNARRASEAADTEDWRAACVDRLTGRVSVKCKCVQMLALITMRMWASVSSCVRVWQELRR